jgi:predicted nucleic acid-binding protein
MNILFDTNVLLDVFLRRSPFYGPSVYLISKVEQSVIEGWLGGTTVTTIHYLLQKHLDRPTAKKHLNTLLELFHIAAVNQLVLKEALDLSFSDYEDAVLHQSALHANLDGIVTRNTRDFSNSSLPIYTPEELENIV